MGYSMFGFLRRKKHNNAKGQIFLFPGREQDPEEMMKLYSNEKLIESTYNIYCMYPEGEWYPRPNGITKQQKSVKGLEKTKTDIIKIIGDMSKSDGFLESDTILAGYSAGAVVACSVWLAGKYGTLVVHNGCVLDVNTIPITDHPKKCLLFHNRDDNCFAWEERYLPTRNTLISNGYDVNCMERSFGGHGITPADVSMAAIMLASPKTS